MLKVQALDSGVGAAVPADTTVVAVAEVAVGEPEDLTAAKTTKVDPAAMPLRENTKRVETCPEARAVGAEAKGSTATDL